MVLTCSIAASPSAYAAAQGPDVSLENDYISITVNNRDENTGRFSIETTGGDPDRSTDDFKHLIYRRPDQGPWTSYTTVNIDGTPWVFGGNTLDAGKGGRFGQMVLAPLLTSDGKVNAAWQLGPVMVNQTLRIVRSSTTGLLDTAAIVYDVKNIDTEPHQVGLRVALDTMLGENDGAPFRAGDEAITTDTLLTGSDIPEFWQAFDSLADPKVTAQGTLRGGEVTVPDKVYFTNWGAIADKEWEFDFKPGRDFTRLGEFDLDSATALWWDPSELAPGEQRTYVIHYGLGGISIAPGQLQIGVAAPTSLVAQPGAEFQVVAYIQNRGDGEARDVQASIQLPNGLQLAPGQSAQRPLGNLPVGDVAQVSWQVELIEGTGRFTYTVGVSAMNAEPNHLARGIQVVSPARLDVRLTTAEDRLTPNTEGWASQPYKVEAAISNSGQATAYGVKAEWFSERGLTLAEGDNPARFIGTLEPGEAVKMHWHVVPTEDQVGNLPYTVQATMPGNKARGAGRGLLFVPPLDSQLEVVVAPPVGKTSAAIAPGDHFDVYINAQNLRDFGGIDAGLTFNSDVIGLLGANLGTMGIERGTLFVNDGPGNELLQWSPSILKRQNSLVTVKLSGQGQATPKPTISGTVAVLHMVAKAPGSTLLLLRDELFADACRFVVSKGTSAVQNAWLSDHFGIDADRAERLLAMMEVRGVVGPYLDGRARRVLVSDLDALSKLEDPFAMHVTDENSQDLFVRAINAQVKVVQK